MMGAAVALGVPLAGSQAEARQAGPDDWLKGVQGANRAFFDFPQHQNGMPLLHILNYLNTYAQAYKLASGQASAVGSLYGIGSRASIALGFNDAMWAKYGLGEYTNLKDAAGMPYTRNVFHRPTANDVHLLMQAINSPTIPLFAGAMPAIGIENLQKMGTTFLMCTNAFVAWCAELEVRGKGKAPELQKELSANLLPGITMVPAMVIAIQKAQAAGITYNRQ